MIVLVFAFLAAHVLMVCKLSAITLPIVISCTNYAFNL